MDKLLGTDQVSPTGKNKINEIIDLLRGGYPGQALTSYGDGGDPSYQDVEPTINGGNTDDVLMKNSNSDGDFDFKPLKPKVIFTSTGIPEDITTNFTFSGATTHNDGVTRHSIITISLLANTDALTQVKVELLKDGVAIETWNTSVLDSAMDTDDYARNLSFSYVSLNSAPNSAFSVKITKGVGSATLRIVYYAFTLLNIVP